LSAGTSAKNSSLNLALVLRPNSRVLSRALLAHDGCADFDGSSIAATGVACSVLFVLKNKKATSFSKAVVFGDRLRVAAIFSTSELSFDYSSVLFF
jgi:hypothetical protein